MKGRKKQIDKKNVAVFVTLLIYQIFTISVFITAAYKLSIDSALNVEGLFLALVMGALLIYVVATHKKVDKVKQYCDYALFVILSFLYAVGALYFIDLL